MWNAFRRLLDALFGAPDRPRPARPAPALSASQVVLAAWTMARDHDREVKVTWDSQQRPRFELGEAGAMITIATRNNPYVVKPDPAKWARRPPGDSVTIASPAAVANMAEALAAEDGQYCEWYLAPAGSWTLISCRCRRDNIPCQHIGDRPPREGQPDGVVVRVPAHR